MRLEIRPDIRTALHVYARLFLAVTGIVLMGQALVTLVREDLSFSWPLILTIIGWSVIVNLGLIYLFGVFYLFERRKRWWVTDEGIEIGSGRVTLRTVPWRHLIKLNVRGHRIVLWLTEAPTFEEICFVDRTVRDQLHDLIVAAR